MIKSLKLTFDKNWKIFKEAKTKVDFSRVDTKTWREVSQWPVTTNPFFPLISRCVIRNEKTDYLLLYLDIILKVDKLAITILENCDGFHSPKEIKKIIKESPEFKDMEDVDSKVEDILSTAGKYGLLIWIPFGQPHLDKLNKA